MPFVSTAQRKYLYANNPKVAAEFEKHTPKGKKLPKHVSMKPMKKVVKKGSKMMDMPNEPTYFKAKKKSKKNK